MNIFALSPRVPSVAVMRQPGNNRLPSREIGATLCRFPDGRLARGPVVSGTRTSLSIPVMCPPGAGMEGLWHTHPGGQAFPSQTDLASARQHGAKVLCVTADGGPSIATNCFRLHRRP